MRKQFTKSSEDATASFVKAEKYVERDDIVGIATRYCVDVPGIESRLERKFPNSPIQALRPNSASCKMSTGYLSRS